MRFLLDENAEARIQAFLLANGHDATRVAREYPAGLSDDQVLALALEERRILVTNDRDFGELVFQQNLPHSGVIFFRLPDSAPSSQKIAILAKLLHSHSDELDQFLVVTTRGVRVRQRRK